MHYPPCCASLHAALQTMKSVKLFLVGALGVISGMMPNYAGNYFGHDVGTNLYCFIIGRYGSGKGSLKWARMLAEPAHELRLKEARRRIEQYGRDKAHYNVQMAQYNKGTLETAPTEPTPPRHLKLFIPANTTKTAVVQLLEENDGAGIIFETEGDTLADMLKQDYGNFSDILRKAFHHEALSFFRRANNEDVSVQRPALSVVLSGTHDQLLKLIPSIDNGLYSRFMFYWVEGNSEFRNPFDANDLSRISILKLYAEKYAAMYQALNNMPTPRSFTFSKDQQQIFYEHYKRVKQHTQEQVSADLDGSINRIALMTYRIAMILTMLRAYEADPQLQPLVYTCADIDLKNALHIMDVLSYNATDVFTYLERYGMQRAGNADLTTPEQKARVMVLKHKGMSYRAIAREVFGNTNSHGRVTRIINSYEIK